MSEEQGPHYCRWDEKKCLMFCHAQDNYCPEHEKDAKIRSQSAELAALRGAMKAAQRLADWSNIGWREFEAKYGKKWTQEKMIDAVAESLASIPAPAADPEPFAHVQGCGCNGDGRCAVEVVRQPAKPTAEAAREAVNEVITAADNLLQGTAPQKIRGGLWLLGAVERLKVLLEDKSNG